MPIGFYPVFTDGLKRPLDTVCIYDFAEGLRDGLLLGKLSFSSGQVQAFWGNISKPVKIGWWVTADRFCFQFPEPRGVAYEAQC